MKFEEALKAMREGKKMRRVSWPFDEFMCIRDRRIYAEDDELIEEIGTSLLTADDWEVYDNREECSETIKVEGNWCSGIHCSSCPITNSPGCKEKLHEKYKKITVTYLID